MPSAKFWSRDISSASESERASPRVWADFSVAELPQKRVCFNIQEFTRFHVTSRLVSSFCQLVSSYSLSVESRALTCPFKESNPSVWSLLSSHVTWVFGHCWVDFKWAGHRLAHVFADGWSTASNQRKMTLLEAPTGTLLFYYKDIKQEIVRTLLLEVYSVSKKLLIIMDRRQNSNTTSTLAGKSGHLAQDR